MDVLYKIILWKLKIEINIDPKYNLRGEEILNRIELEEGGIERELEGQSLVE